MKLLPPAPADQLLALSTKYSNLEKEHENINGLLKRCRISRNDLEDEKNDLQHDVSELEDEVRNLEDQLTTLEMEVLEGPIRPEINTNYLDPINNIFDELRLKIAVNLAHNLDLDELQRLNACQPDRIDMNLKKV